MSIKDNLNIYILVILHFLLLLFQFIENQFIFLLRIMFLESSLRKDLKELLFYSQNQ